MTEHPSAPDPTPAPLRFGVNYTPSRQWMHSWLALKPDDVRRDFAQIAGLGLDHVRVFPLWPLLQPNRTLIRAGALDDVRTVVDIAAEFGLDAGVDVIQGHLSSFDFIPAWLATWHDRNMFSDPQAVDAQIELVRALGSRLADAPNFLGLTLGNEVNQFSDRPHPSPWPIHAEQAQAWLTGLLDAAAQVAPQRQHVHSEYDAVWYLDGHPFTPAHASRFGAMTTVHSWIFNGTAQRYGGVSTASSRHAEYLIELSRAFQTDPGRRIWLQEVGAPSNCLTEAEVPGFVEATVRSAARTEGLWGITWWCSHDVSRELADFPELEYTLGLIDQTGAAKPAGLRFAELAAELRETRLHIARSTAIVIDVDANEVPVSRSALSPGGAVFQAWVDLCEAGVDPCFVTSTDAADAVALASRGITELVRPDLKSSFVGAYSSVNTVTPGPTPSHEPS
ncbi:cellulase family glycosylhydrolase [Humibacter antri]